MIKTCQVGVKGVVKVGDSVLVLKKERGDGGYWNIPGGRIDDNETLEETLVRELQEELPSLGEYTIGGVIHATRLSKNIDGDLALVLVFYKVEAEAFEVALNHEHAGYMWVNRDTVGQLLQSDLSIEPGYYTALTRALELG